MSNVKIIVDASLFDDLSPEGIVKAVKSIDVLKEQNQRLAAQIVSYTNRIEYILNVDSDMFNKIKQLRDLLSVMKGDIGVQ
jgi:peptidoglycan hydrolase CwlO-like protein